DHTYAGVEDDLNFSVGYTISDADGDSADGVLRVTVDDDSGRANDDSATTDNATPVTLDVLANDDHGADGPGRVIEARVDGGVDVGSVTVNPDGTLTFVPHVDFVGDALIDYTGTDGDGDTSAGRLAVTVGDRQGNDTPSTPETDGDPDTRSPEVVIDEDGLVDGVPGGHGDVPGESTSATGFLGYDFGGNGRGSFRWSTDGLPAVPWRVNAVGDTLSGSYGGSEIIVIRLLDADTGSYRVDVHWPLDHPDDSGEDNLDFAVGYTITDSDGDAADGVLHVSLNDDSVVANDDSARIPRDTAVTVDVLANDAHGADGRGGVIDASVRGGSDVGSVTVNPDDTLTFTPHPDFVGTALVDYTTSDHDGDTANATLSVQVVEGSDSPSTPGSDPDVPFPEAVVDEDGLFDGHPGGEGDVPGRPIVASGSLGYVFGDDGRGSFRWSTEGLPALTSQGSPLSWTLDDTRWKLTGHDADGNEVLIIRMTDIDSGSYRVRLLGTIDHSDTAGTPVEGDISFAVGYTITDRYGDAASGELRVRVNDDSAHANDDEARTFSDTAVRVGVLGNDDPGADGLGSVVAASVQGGADVGSVSVNPDGTLTFVPHPDFVGDALIDYSGNDGDGTTTDGQLTVQVRMRQEGDTPITPETDGDPDTQPVSIVLDEDGLAGSADYGVFDVPGEQSSAIGTLGYDFGVDGPGSFTWHTDGLPLLVDDPFEGPYEWSLSDDGRTLIGDVRLELTDLATGAFMVDNTSAVYNDGRGYRLEIGYTVTDSNGDEADGVLRVSINDSVTITYDDYYQVYQGYGAIQLDVLANDALSADPVPAGDYILHSPFVEGGDSVGKAYFDSNDWLFFEPAVDFVGTAEVFYSGEDGDFSGFEGRAFVEVVGGTPATSLAMVTLDEDGLSSESRVVTGFLGYDFGTDGPGSMYWSTADLPSLTSHGSPLGWSRASGDLLIATDADGAVVIRAEVTDIVTGAYRIELLQPLDHAAGGSEDEIRFDIGYSINDSNVDSADGVLRLSAIDDSGRANDDSARTFVATPTTLDVLANDEHGGDGPGRVIDASVQGGGAVGSVAINADNTLTFVPAAGFSGDALIDYTASDGDGDTSAGRLAVEVRVGQGSDHPTTPETGGSPGTGSVTVTVDEDGLPGGDPGGPGDVPGAISVVNGSLGYDFGNDGSDGFTWHTAALPMLTSGGSPLSWTLNSNGRSLVGAAANGDSVISVQLTDVASGAYRVSIDRPLDHHRVGTEDDISLAVGYTITDSDGDGADGVLRIRVDDDSGRAVNDSIRTNVSTPVTLDVLANDIHGADGPGSISYASGNVTINPDNTLTYVPSPGFEGTDTIVYRSSDADGDMTEGTVTILVRDGGDTPTTPETDDDPHTRPVDTHIDEDNLPGGIRTGAWGDEPFSPLTRADVIEYDFGYNGPGGFSWHIDGLPTLTSGGSPVDWRLSDNGLLLEGVDGNGDQVITLKIDDMALGSFRLALVKPLDHAITPDYFSYENNIDFEVGYTITDAVGNAASGVFKFFVDDDSGLALDDSARTDSDTPITVDVYANDRHGADGPGSVIGASVQGGAGVGSVTVNADNTLTFVPDPSFSGVAVVDYIGSDGDGDRTEAALTVNVTGGDPTRPVTPETDGDPGTVSARTVVDEDGLPGGNPGGGVGDVPDELAEVTGSLGYDFGSEGPGTFRWNSEGLPSLTSQGRPLSWSLNATGHIVGASDSEGNEVISVELTDIDSGDYRVELHQALDHRERGYINYEDDIDFSVGFTITDSQGTSAEGELDIVVNDDHAVAREEVIIVDDDPFTFDVVSPGADGVRSLEVTDVEPIYASSGSGRAVVNPDNSVTFAPDSDFLGGPVTFSFLVVDGDSDRSYMDVEVDIPRPSGSADGRAFITAEPFVLDADEEGGASALEAAVQDDVPGNVVANAEAGRLALSELLDDESDDDVSAWLPPEQDQTDSVGPASAGGSGGGSDSGADSEQALALNGAGVPGAGDTTLERIGQEA
ncbi:MAG: tandem-95 repeat protein, partial [Gammaproteobacteria bacterium]|nr:tandem-95 repeat protein [Gammaproteobacteria bacterium]